MSVVNTAVDITSLKVTIYRSALLKWKSLLGKKPKAFNLNSIKNFNFCIKRPRIYNKIVMQVKLHVWFRNIYSVCFYVDKSIVVYKPKIQLQEWREQQKSLHSWVSTTFLKNCTGVKRTNLFTDRFSCREIIISLLKKYHTLVFHVQHWWRVFI